MKKNKIINIVGLSILMIVFCVGGVSIFNARAKNNKPASNTSVTTKLTPELSKKLTDAIVNHDKIVQEAHTDLQAEILEVFIKSNQNRKTTDLIPTKDGGFEFVPKAAK
jgi:hypothetical protein